MKNNYRLILLCLLQCVSLLTIGQVITFVKVYHSSINQNGLDALPMKDGGYFIASSTENTPNGLNFMAMKTDKYGDTLWTKIYVDPNLDTPTSLLQASDGNYFILGYTQISGKGQQTYLLKVDTLGNLLWSKTYGNTGVDDGNNIIASSDGNYMITGESISNGYLMKIDINGTILWTKYYGSPSYTSFRSVALCQDGGFILTGKIAKTNQSGINQENYRLYIVRTNSSGDTIWTKSYGGADSYEGKYILANSDKSFTLCIDDSSLAADSDVRLMKIDSVGNVKWNNDFGGTKKDISKMVQHTDDGGYILVGISRSFGWINPYMWILKFNSGGDTIWSRRFGSFYHNHGYAVRQTTDKGYMAVGHEDNSNYVSQVMLVKTDSMGNLLSTNSVAEFGSTKLIHVYPNPTDGAIQIDLNGMNIQGAQLEIYNALGQILLSERVSDFNQNNLINIDLKGNNSGIYFLNLKSDGCLMTKKFILQ